MARFYLTEKEIPGKYFERGDIVRVTDTKYVCDEDGAITNMLVCGGHPDVCKRNPGKVFRAVCPIETHRFKNSRGYLPEESKEDIRGIEGSPTIKSFSHFSRLEL